jgi:hypothetical protein
MLFNSVWTGGEVLDKKHQLLIKIYINLRLLFKLTKNFKGTKNTELNYSRNATTLQKNSKQTLQNQATLKKVVHLTEICVKGLVGSQATALQG